MEEKSKELKITDYIEISARKKDYLILFAVNIVAGLLIYVSLYTLQLTNVFDGLLNGGAYYIASEWELSIGRWLWRFLDCSRGGYAADPLNSYLALFFLSAGNVILADVFSFADKKRAWLMSIFILSGTTVCCFLSYRYMSPTFGLAYLLSIFGAWLLVKCSQKIIAVIFSAVIICFSMGLYQADLGCFCVIVVFMVLLKVSDDSLRENVIFLQSLLSFFLSCILYKIIWDIELMIYRVDTAEYRGADRISLINMIIQLPNSISSAYRAFTDYFLSGGIRHSLFQDTVLYNLILLATAVCAAFIIILYKKHIPVVLLSFLLLFYLPVVCCISFLLAPDTKTLSVQMTAPVVIVIPCLFCVLSKLSERYTKHSNVFTKVTVVLMSLMIYGNVYSTVFDLNAMYEGRNATQNLLRNVIVSLTDKGLYSDSYRYVFVGNPCDNFEFCQTLAWRKSNRYAQRGRYAEKSDNRIVSYSSEFKTMGITVNMESDPLIYENFCNDERVQKMNCYPAEDSIQVIDGYVIIKIS